jgi:hypothetical protein
MVKGAIGVFGRGPGRLLIVCRDDGGVGFAGKLGGQFFVPLKVVEVFEEEYPGGLLYVVEFAAASCVFTQAVVYVLEGLLKQWFSPDDEYKV